MQNYKIKTSPEIDQIATALSDFQAVVSDAQKDSQGHNYTYANLHTILQLIRPLMGTHGLALTQFPVGDALNVGVASRLMHSSGQWMESYYLMGVTESRGMSSSQSSGSVLSYARRYAAASILGITQVDPDAEVEDPIIEPATTVQFDKINKFVQDGNVPEKTLTWLQVEENWNNLTSNQAKTIIQHIEGQLDAT